MAVYPRPGHNPLRNEDVNELLEWARRNVRDISGVPPESLYGAAPGFREMTEAMRAHNERMSRDIRAREGVTDLVLIDGVWQVPTSSR